ncbi:MAG: methylated-DNA--[protein]-cysteine S-methyltransferase [Rickettsiales bacterium]|nr:methylated-DNA--[protein]-cysteine S-methyltransferase [Rickettsiales bacterium]
MERINVDKLSGTEFQKSVWRELLNIPRGEVIAYAELARRIGRPTAVRAVANAVGKNPMAPAIPCHRVVRSDGGLGGYSGCGGIATKKKLLAAEGVVFD